MMFDVVRIVEKEIKDLELLVSVASNPKIKQELEERLEDLKENLVHAKKSVDEYLLERDE